MRFLLLLPALLLPVAAPAAPVTHAIKLDHFGYRPADTKISIFSGDPGSAVEVRDTSDAVVFRVPGPVQMQ